MPTLYAAHDLMFNPTTADNQPLTLIEGLASGVLIVSTDAGGIPDLVQHEVEALLVPVGDDEALAAAALRLRADAGLCARLRAHGYSKAAQFSWPKVRTALLRSYQRG
jgi:glycosyltransferase involved in cell wall biosynthesis